MDTKYPLLPVTVSDCELTDDKNEASVERTMGAIITAGA